MCTCVTNLGVDYPIAKRGHDDSSAEFIKEFLSYRPLRGSGLSFSEWREIAKLKANNWKILKGQKYESQRNIMDGTIYRFKTLPAIARICSKYEFYPEC